MRTAPRFALWTVIDIVVLAALWQILGLTLTGNAQTNMSGPGQMVLALIELAKTPLFWDSVGHTLYSALVGWVIAAVLGVIFGAALANSRIVSRFSETSVDLLRTVPSVVIVPVMVIVFGYTSLMEIVVVASGAIWPVVIATADSLRVSSRERKDVARALRLGHLRSLFSVEFPGAADGISAGLRIALGLAFVLAVVAELAGNPAGIGYQIVRSQQALRPDAMFAYIFVIGLIAVAANGLFLLLARRSTGRRPR